VALCTNCHRKEHARLIKIKQQNYEDKNNQLINQKLTQLLKIMNGSNDLMSELNTFAKKLLIEHKQLSLSCKFQPIKETEICPKCNMKKYEKAKYCDKCFRTNRRTVERPSKNQLLSEIAKLGYCGTGRKYGVSDNAIRKWLKNY
jgi:hypothetical protein